MTDTTSWLKITRMVNKPKPASKMPTRQTGSMVIPVVTRRWQTVKLHLHPRNNKANVSQTRSG